MKNTLILSLLLAAAVAPTLPVSAQTPNPLFRHIPPDADAIYHVNLPTLTSKMSLTAIFTVLNFGRLPNGPTLSSLKDLFNSGIDTTKDFIIARSNVFHKDSLGYTTMIAHLNDSGRFVAFLHRNERGLNYSPGNPRVATSQGSAYAWNDRLVVMLIMHHPSGQTAEDLFRTPSDAAHRCLAALGSFDHSFFTTDPNFLAVFADDADAHFWNKHSSGFGGLSAIIHSTGPQGQLGGLSQVFGEPGKTQSNSMGSLRFETGKISYRNIRVLSPNDSSLVAKNVGASLGASLFTGIPPGKLLAMVALHRDIRTLANEIGGIQKKGATAGPMPKNNFSADDIRQALTGDLLVLAYDPPDTQLVPHGSGKTPLFYLVAGVSNKPAFERVAKAMKISGPADAATADSSGLHAHYAFENDAVVISFTSQAVDRYLHPDPAQTPAHPERRFLTEELRANSSAMAGVDFGPLATFFRRTMTKGGTLAAKDQSTIDILRHFDSFLLNSTAVHGNESITQFELRLADAGRNSFPVLIGILGPLFRP
jgi:hypothetical protein